MMAKLFVTLCRIPLARKLLFKGLYEFLAAFYNKNSEWVFMNYGYDSEEMRANRIQLRPEDESERYFIQLYHRVASAVDLKGGRVLEVGSGRGGGASYVKRYLAPAEMHGLDLSAGAVEFCRKNHGHVEGLRFHQGDAENLPFDSESVDAVVNVESSHCYRSMPDFLSEVYRVLKPGGHFLFTDFRGELYRDFSGDDPVATLRSQLDAAGFTKVEEEDVAGHVREALDVDALRKKELMARSVPAWMRGMTDDFAGMEGSVFYEALRTKSIEYLRFVLRKPAG